MQKSHRLEMEERHLAEEYPGAAGYVVDLRKVSGTTKITNNRTQRRNGDI